MDQTSHHTNTHDGLDTFGVAPKIIDLKNTKTDVIWESYRLPVSSSLYWDGGSKAFLRLQVSVNVTTPNHHKENHPLFLIIPPERIKQLSVGVSTDLAGLETQTLDFVLHRCPFLVVSSEPSIPKDDASKITKDLFYALAGQLQFSLRVKIPGRVVSSEDWHNFRRAAAGGSLAMANDRANIKIYYRGGGTIVEGDTILACSAGIATGAESLQASPEALAPEYCELPPSMDSVPAYTETPAIVDNYAGSSMLQPQDRRSSQFDPPKKHRRTSSTAVVEASALGCQSDPPKRQRCDSTTDVKEDNIGVLRRLAVEVFSGLEQELRTLKDELRETKQDLQATKQELHDTKLELEQVKTRTSDLEKYLDSGLTTDEVNCLIHDAIQSLELYSTDEVDELLFEVKVYCEGLDHREREHLVDQAISKLDIYTSVEVDERLGEVQRQCEGLNCVEAEDLVIGAKMDLQEWVQDGIKDTKRVISKWIREAKDKFQEASDHMTETFHTELRRLVRKKSCRKMHGFAAIGSKKYNRHLRAAIKRVQTLQPPPRLGSVNSTASAVSTASFNSTS
ncbi:hypothetical protein VM1G_02563 [Cytospora mali]|uniref:Uncharacterized protein n=1 Tax=Cytospora mali TaxID=578113 RepID=A0A194VUN2_CYTMA|nr:hypothetical protein VM1G_02563 [Valsa mali]